MLLFSGSPRDMVATPKSLLELFLSQICRDNYLGPFACVEFDRAGIICGLFGIACK